MLSKVIGIISYLPDNRKIANHRFKLLKDLIIKCDELFNLPIIIIAQNWLEDEIKEIKLLSANLTIKQYKNALGIKGARQKLRSYFLEKTEYEYLIFLDDDCIIEGTQGDKYLEQIDNNPNCFIEFNKTLLKLFAVSRLLLERADFDEINPEKEEGFEDRAFVNKLRIFYPEFKREFQKYDLKETSISTADPYSTWYKEQDLKKMLANTENKIKEFKK